jgi:hypothetical protein
MTSSLRPQSKVNRNCPPRILDVCAGKRALISVAFPLNPVVVAHFEVKTEDLGPQMIGSVFPRSAVDTVDVEIDHLVVEVLYQSVINSIVKSRKTYLPSQAHRTLWAPL